MLGWILAAIGAGYVISKIDESEERNKNDVNLCKTIIRDQQKTIRAQSVQIGRLREENYKLKLTIGNQQQLLREYNLINNYAKKIGFKYGAVEFFYYLAKNHDQRFEGLARFLYKVKCMRNEVAHEGMIYEIDQGFLKKLNACWKICEYHKNLPFGQKLLLN